MRLAERGRNVVIRKQVKDEVGHEPIARSGRLESGWRTICEDDLGPGTERRQTRSSQLHHGGTQVEPAVARERWKMMREEAKPEAARAAAELEHATRCPEIAVLDQDLGGTIFVEGLSVLSGADAVVETPGFVAREHRHAQRTSPFSAVQRIGAHPRGPAAAEHRPKQTLRRQMTTRHDAAPLGRAGCRI